MHGTCGKRPAGPHAKLLCKFPADFAYGLGSALIQEIAADSWDLQWISKMMRRQHESSLAFSFTDRHVKFCFAEHHGLS